MSFNKRATNEQIINAYKETGSVWAAAKKLGLCGQSVWERLRKLNYEMPSATWSKSEIAELRQLIQSGRNLTDISKTLGRSYGGTATKASQLGLKVIRQWQKKPKRKIPDILATEVMIAELDTFAGTFTAYCRQRAIKPDGLANAIQKFNPEFWVLYAKRNGVEQKICKYCEQPFFPMSNKQATCTRKCQYGLRVDKKYFNGNRRNTVGLSEATCQLCGLKQREGLSSHHVVGVENDPDSNHLVALCRGCHRLVEAAAGVQGSETAEFWEKLIGFAMAKKLSPSLKFGVHVCVEIELITTQEEFEAA